MLDISETGTNYGVILIVDIVEFTSNVDSHSAVGMVDSLEREVRRFFPTRHWRWGHPYQESEGDDTPGYMGWPPTFVSTGDGFILAYPWGYSPDVLDSTPELRKPLYAAAVGLVAHLYRYCRGWRWRGEDAGFGLRAGMHVGFYHRRYDAYGGENVIGGSIVHAHRVVERAGRGGHFLVSEAAFGHLRRDFCLVGEHPAWRFRGLAADVRATCDEWHVPYDRCQLGDDEAIHAVQCVPWRDKHDHEYIAVSIYTETADLGDPAVLTTTKSSA